MTIMVTIIFSIIVIMIKMKIKYIASMIISDVTYENNINEITICNSSEK